MQLSWICILFDHYTFKWIKQKFKEKIFFESFIFNFYLVKSGISLHKLFKNHFSALGWQRNDREVCLEMCTKRRDVHRIRHHIMSVVCEIFCQGNSFIILNTRCVFLEKIMQSKGVIFRSIAKIILKKCAYLNSIYTIFTINIHLQTMVCFTHFRFLFMR